MQSISPLNFSSIPEGVEFPLECKTGVCELGVLMGMCRFVSMCVYVHVLMLGHCYNTAAGGSPVTPTDTTDYGHSVSHSPSAAGDTPGGEENKSLLCVNAVSIVELNIDKHSELLYILYLCISCQWEIHNYFS